MPEPGNIDPGKGQAGRGDNDYRTQRYPGAGGLDPSQMPLGQECREPSNEIAASVMAWVQDPCARMAVQMLLEECFRNFYLHSAEPSWIKPPFAAFGEGGGTIVDRVGEGSTGVSSGTFVEIFTEDVARGEILILSGFGQGVLVAAAWDEITWRFVRRERGTAITVGDQIGIPPYDSIGHQYGQIDILTTIYAIIRGPATVGLQIAGTGTDRTAHARVQGWRYPVKMVDDQVGTTIVD